MISITAYTDISWGNISTCWDWYHKYLISFRYNISCYMRWNIMYHFVFSYKYLNFGITIAANTKTNKLDKINFHIKISNTKINKSMPICLRPQHMLKLYHDTSFIATLTQWKLMTHMCQSLVQKMVCHMFGTNPLTKTMLTIYQLDPKWQTSVNQNTSVFWGKCIWKCCLHHGIHFVWASVYGNTSGAQTGISLNKVNTIAADALASCITSHGIGQICRYASHV